jgi:chromosome segregation ATPase
MNEQELKEIEVFWFDENGSDDLLPDEFKELALQEIQTLVTAVEATQAENNILTIRNMHLEDSISKVTEKQIWKDFWELQRLFEASQQELASAQAALLKERGEFFELQSQRNLAQEDSAAQAVIWRNDQKEIADLRIQLAASQTEADEFSKGEVQSSKAFGELVEENIKLKSGIEQLQADVERLQELKEPLVRWCNEYIDEISQLKAEVRQLQEWIDANPQRKRAYELDSRN